MKSCLNLPQRATAGVGVTCILAGYSKLRSAYKRCASLLDSHSINFWASAGLSECFTTPAPETLTCVPLPAWLAKNTLTLLAT